MNRKGIVTNPIIWTMAIIIGAANMSGALFTGGNPAQSAFLMATTALTTYSQMPHVVKDFRQRKAAKMGIDTTGMTDEEVLDAIRDDKMYSGGNQGNFVGGYMK